MVLMVPLLIMATSLVSKINTRVALVKGWVNSSLAFMGQLYIGFYTDGEGHGRGPFGTRGDAREGSEEEHAGYYGVDCPASLFECAEAAGEDETGRDQSEKAYAGEYEVYKAVPANRVRVRGRAGWEAQSWIGAKDPGGHQAQPIEREE